MDQDSSWNEIDYAERCLVSAMYDEALNVSASTLRTLCSDPKGEVNGSPMTSGQISRGGSEYVELALMVEAAGMVFLQALSQMGRSGNIFDEMIPNFGDVRKVPYSLILTGTCLQLSAGFPPSTRKLLEEYLSGWAPPRRSTDEFMVSVSENSQKNFGNENCDSERNDDVNPKRSCQFHLARQDYLQLAELFAIEVLAKVCKNPGAAQLWVTSSSRVSAEEKEAILAKLQSVSPSSRQNVSNGHTQDGAHLREATKASSSIRYSDERETEGMVEAPETSSSGTLLNSTVDHSATAAVDPDSRTVVRSSRIWRFPIVRTILRLVELLMNRLMWSFKWTSRHTKLPQRDTLVTGAFSSIALYALLRKRQQLSRWIMALLSLAKVCFIDLWRLAFTVHLNPLVAV